MTIDEINKEWAKDSVIDGTRLFYEQQRVSLLHSKYYALMMQASAKLAVQRVKLATIKRDKTEYYSGQMDPAEIKSRGWEPMNKRILKTDVETYVETDPDVVEMSLKVGLAHDKYKYLESILKDISYNLSKSVRTMFEIMRFEQGG